MSLTTELPPTLEIDAENLDVLADAYDARAAAIIDKLVPAYFTMVDGLPEGGRGSAEELQVAEARLLIIEARVLRATAGNSRALAARLGSTAAAAPGAISLGAITTTTTTAALTWTYAPGGPLDEQTITGGVAGAGTTISVNGASSPALDASARSYTLTGLKSNTTYVITLAGVGAGGNVSSTVQFLTQSDPVPVQVGTFRSAASVAVDNDPTVDCPKPAGLTAGDFMVAWYSNDTGLNADISAPAGWTEETRARIGVGDAIAHFRVWWHVATAADVAATLFTFGSSIDSSTDVAIHAYGNGIDRINAVSIAASLGTNVAIVAPSVQTTVPNTIIATAVTYTPTPAGARTVSPGGSMSERSDTNTPGGFRGLETATVAQVGAGNSGTKTHTVSGAIAASSAVTIALNGPGSDPFVANLAGNLLNTQPSSIDLHGDWAGSDGTSYNVEVTGDGQPSFSQAGTSVTRTLPRQVAAYTVSLQVQAVIGTAVSGWVTVGPFTVPALAGGGVLPARTTVNNYLVLANGQTYQDKRYVHPGTPNDLHSTVDGTQAPFTTIDNAPHLQNVEVNGGTDGRQGVYGNTLWLQDIDVKSWGNAISVGTSNPNNQHAFYVRGGVWRRVHIFPPAYNTAGTYGVHCRAGDGTNISHENYDMIDESGKPGYIGGGNNIVDILWDGYHKVGTAGLFTCGGLAGGNHQKAVFRNCIWDGALTITGNWAVGLTFTNCRCKSLIDNASGVKSLSGLTVTG